MVHVDRKPRIERIGLTQANRADRRMTEHSRRNVLVDRLRRVLVEQGLNQTHGFVQGDRRQVDPVRAIADGEDAVDRCLAPLIHLDRALAVHRHTDVLEPDTATLASVGLTRSHSVWEYLWEDSEAEQALFQEELDKVRGYVHEFMLKHPDMKGGRNTGEKQPEEETWSKKQRRKRTEMEKAVAAYRETKSKKEAAKRAAKEAKAAEEKKTANAITA